jgi:alanine racemase
LGFYAHSGKPLHKFFSLDAERLISQDLCMSQGPIEFSDGCPKTDLVRTWCEISAGALRRNFRRVAARLRGGGLIVSAKKEAYGHGLVGIATALREEKGFAAVGLATIEEALDLRARFAELPILLFSVLRGQALREAVRAGLILTVTDVDDGRAAAQAANETARAARAHFKLDTGMTRLGRRGDEAATQVAELRALPGLHIEAIYSHLADAWNDPASARAQVARLDTFCTRTGLESLPRHWGGSDGLRLIGELPEGTGLRAGIALYGDHPALPELEPVMTFKSRVVYRKAVPKGTAVSYGGTYVTERETQIAVVGAGYGNGYLRVLGNRASVLIGGRRCPILGRVCMDQFMIDVTDGPQATVGDEVVLFGRQGDLVLPAAEVAAAAGTISYELFCLAGGMNPRVWVD